MIPWYSQNMTLRDMTFYNAAGMSLYHGASNFALKFAACSCHAPVIAISCAVICRVTHLCIACAVFGIYEETGTNNTYINNQIIPYPGPVGSGGAQQAPLQSSTADGELRA